MHRKPLVSFTNEELQMLVTDPKSMVVMKKHVTEMPILPANLNNVGHSVRDNINRLMGTFINELGGILLCCKDIEILEPCGNTSIYNPSIYIKVKASFYVFSPEIGVTLSGKVNKVHEDYLGCIVHKLFNVAIPRPTCEGEEQKLEEWIGNSYSIGDTVSFVVQAMDFSGSLPYIEGKLLLEEQQTDICKKEKKLGTSEKIRSIDTEIGNIRKKKKKDKEKDIKVDISANYEPVCDNLTIQDELSSGLKKKKKKKDKQQIFEKQNNDFNFIKPEKNLIGNEIIDDKLQSGDFDKSSSKHKKRRKEKERHISENEDNHNILHTENQSSYSNKAELLQEAFHTEKRRKRSLPENAHDYSKYENKTEDDTRNAKFVEILSPSQKHKKQFSTQAINMKNIDQIDEDLERFETISESVSTSLNEQAKKKKKRELKVSKEINSHMEENQNKHFLNENDNHTLSAKILSPKQKHKKMKKDSSEIDAQSTATSEYIQIPNVTEGKELEDTYSKSKLSKVLPKLKKRCKEESYQHLSLPALRLSPTSKVLSLKNTDDDSSVSGDDPDLSINLKATPQADTPRPPKWHKSSADTCNNLASTGNPRKVHDDKVGKTSQMSQDKALPSTNQFKNKQNKHDSGDSSSDDSDLPMNYKPKQQAVSQRSQTVHKSTDENVKLKHHISDNVDFAKTLAGIQNSTNLLDNKDGRTPQMSTVNKAQLGSDLSKNKQSKHDSDDSSSDDSDLPMNYKAVSQTPPNIAKSTDESKKLKLHTSDFANTLAEIKNSSNLRDNIEGRITQMSTIKKERFGADLFKNKQDDSDNSFSDDSDLPMNYKPKQQAVSKRSPNDKNENLKHHISDNADIASIIARIGNSSKLHTKSGTPTQISMVNKPQLSSGLFNKKQNKVDYDNSSSDDSDLPMNYKPQAISQRSGPPKSKDKNEKLKHHISGNTDFAHTLAMIRNSSNLLDEKDERTSQMPTVKKEPVSADVLKNEHNRDNSSSDDSDLPTNNKVAMQSISQRSPNLYKNSEKNEKLHVQMSNIADISNTLARIGNLNKPRQEGDSGISTVSKNVLSTNLFKSKQNSESSFSSDDSDLPINYTAKLEKKFPLSQEIQSGIQKLPDPIVSASEENAKIGGQSTKKKRKKSDDLERHSVKKVKTEMFNDESNIPNIKDVSVKFENTMQQLKERFHMSAIRNKSIYTPIKNEPQNTVATSTPLDNNAELSKYFERTKPVKSKKKTKSTTSTLGAEYCPHEISPSPEKLSMIKSSGLIGTPPRGLKDRISVVFEQSVDNVSNTSPVKPINVKDESLDLSPTHSKREVEGNMFAHQNVKLFNPKTDEKGDSSYSDDSDLPSNYIHPFSRNFPNTEKAPELVQAKESSNSDYAGSKMVTDRKLNNKRDCKEKKLKKNELIQNLLHETKKLQGGHTKRSKKRKESDKTKKETKTTESLLDEDHGEINIEDITMRLLKEVTKANKPKKSNNQEKVTQSRKKSKTKHELTTVKSEQLEVRHSPVNDSKSPLKSHATKMKKLHKSPVSEENKNTVPIISTLKSKKSKKGLLADHHRTKSLVDKKDKDKKSNVEKLEAESNVTPGIAEENSELLANLANQALFKFIERRKNIL